MRIALVVDNPLRDLPGLVLLAMRLCQHGATCYLVPMYFTSWKGRELLALAPDFVLLNYLRFNNQFEAHELLNLGIKVGVQDSEGGVLESIDTYAKSLAPDPAVRHQITCYCSWGPKLAEFVRREAWFGEAPVVVTGTPRYDFYAPRWREAALRSSPYAEDFQRPMVLINGNFQLINPRFQTPEQEVKTLVDMGYDYDCVVDWQRKQGQAMVDMARLTNRLAARFPYVSFIYRPHPFEKLETYHDLLESWVNLHLVKEGAVTGWILRARAVIQRSCSTGIEAVMAGIPSLTPNWIPSALETPTVDEVSIRCETEEDLSRALESTLSGHFELPAHTSGRLQENIENWFYRLDGCAHERLADCILQHLPADSARQRLRKCRDAAYGMNGGPISWKRWTRVTLADTLGPLVPRLFPRWYGIMQDLSWWPSSEKYFNAQHVQFLVEAIRTCMDQRSLRRVCVQSTQQRGDYYFGYRHGQSVTVFST